MGDGGPTDGPGSPTLTAPFWAAAAQHRLVRPVCAACGASFFTPSVCCPRCRSEQWQYEESSGRGVVYSHTTVHRGPDPSWATPYVLAVIDLEEGWSMLSRLRVEPPSDEVPGQFIGVPVRVQFEREDRLPHRTLPVFSPTEVS